MLKIDLIRNIRVNTNREMRNPNENFYISKKTKKAAPKRQEVCIGLAGYNFTSRLIICGGYKGWIRVSIAFSHRIIFKSCIYRFFCLNHCVTQL